MELHVDYYKPIGHENEVFLWCRKHSIVCWVEGNVMTTSDGVAFGMIILADEPEVETMLKIRFPRLKYVRHIRDEISN